MWRSILLILCGAALVSSARVFENSKRKTLQADVRGIAMLRTRVDSVSALYASAFSATDSARLKKELDDRIDGIGRRQYHIPYQQQTLAEWWRPNGYGTFLSVVGVLSMLLGILFLRRTARTQRRD